MQPRCLARTELVRRVVFEDGRSEPVSAEEEDEDSLSDYQQENVRFWTAVLRDYAFSDVTVELPGVTMESTLYVKVRGSGHGDWGLSFVAFLFRGEGGIGCYFTCRSGVPQAERVFGAVSAELEGLREELGAGPDYWENRAGRPRVGFRRETRLPFPADGATNGEFDDAVAWMRDHLDLLVSGLYARVQRMLRDGT